MPRYFIDTFNGLAVIDDVGHELPDRATLRRVVKRTLSDLMRDETDEAGRMQFRANVRDETGTQIMTVTLLMIVDEHSEPRAC